MNPLAVISGTYDYRLVALSVILAMVASHAALDLAGRVASAKGRARILWLGAGAMAMGVGIWAMHYIGMLALETPMLILYHVPTVAVSLLAAVCASAVALFVASRPKMDFREEAFGGVVMGIGIAAMHYIGMAAMRCAAVTIYDRRIVAVSIILAIAISVVALQFAFRRRDDAYMSWRKIFSAVVMGGAIPLMHYTGMRAASFHPATIDVELNNTVGISAIGTAAISVFAFLILAGAIATCYVDRFVALHKTDLNLVRERELYFQKMAEAIPDLIWTANIDGAVDYGNGNLLQYTGKTIKEVVGGAWTDVIHPDDLDSCFGKWKNALQTGEPYQVEYRVRAKDGSFRWFLGRANPIRNSAGEIIKWFGVCTDIESQKQNQQILEEQILERTMQLADANTRLQQEMEEKDLTRRQLDEEHDRMMTDLQHRTERATMLAKMGELLQSSLTRDEVIGIALGYAPKIFPGARGAVLLLNPGRSFAEVAGAWSDCQLSANEFEITECWALRTGQPHLVYVDDPAARCAHAADLKSSYLCIPILAQGETLGILHLQAKSNAIRLEAIEVSFTTTFAGQVGLSIANIKLRDALRMQSIRDALTGLYNRRYLEEILERELRRAARAQQHLGVVLIDLDHFKKFNDAFGHDAGDAVLRETGLCLGKNIRMEDFVCRYGGEEFVVILPTANLEAAQARAESLRLKMRELVILHQGKSMGMITISAGVAAFPDHGATLKELIAAADAALYEAKGNGRDQVVISNHAKIEV